MDRLAAMEAFVAVVNAGSFARAAEKLRLSRAMVSKHVLALESRLGARLLNRTTRKVSLTEAGQAFHARAADLIAEFAAAEELVAETAAPRGLLRITAPVSFGHRHLAPIITAFLARHPAMRCELALSDRMVDLVEEGYDLAVRIARLKDSSLIARRIAPARMVLCASPDYLAKAGAPRAPADLARHDCLDYTYSSTRNEWRLVGRDGREFGVRVEGRLRANDGEALAAAARAGAGIAYLPTFIIGDDLRAKILIPVLPGWTAPNIAVHAVYPAQRQLPVKVRAFVDHLLGTCGAAPPWDRGLDKILSTRSKR